jgi:8-oxo-dGTP pyrophosphatase MutT (NUDIX family)
MIQRVIHTGGSLWQAYTDLDRVINLNHIEELRTLIGHRPILMVGAAVLIQDPLRRLLMLKRSDSQCWGLPGGAVEPGEKIEEAARRETYEETGLRLPELELFGVFSGPELFFEYPNGDQVYNVSIIYQVQSAAGSLRLNEEHTTWQYFAVDELPTSISPPLLPVLHAYVSRQKASAR